MPLAWDVTTAVLVQLERQDEHPELERTVPYVTQHFRTTVRSLHHAYAKPVSKSASAWLLALLERKPRKLAAVALANKMARIVWAMMATGEAYRGSKGTAAAA